MSCILSGNLFLEWIKNLLLLYSKIMSRRNCEWDFQCNNFRGTFIFLIPNHQKTGTSPACLTDSAHTIVSPKNPFLCLHDVFFLIADMYTFTLESYFRHKLHEGCRIKQSHIVQDATKNRLWGHMLFQWWNVLHPSRKHSSQVCVFQDIQKKS